MRRVKPCADGKGIHCHRCPLKEDGSDGKVVLATSLDDVGNACWHMSNEEGKEQEWNPDVQDGELAEDARVTDIIGYSIGPYLWAVITGEYHDGACYN